MMSGASGTDRRKLVGIADQNETAILRDRVDDLRGPFLRQFDHVRLGDFSGCRAVRAGVPVVRVGAVADLTMF